MTSTEQLGRWGSLIEEQLTGNQPFRRSKGIARVTARSDRDEFLKLVDDHGAVVFALLRRLCGNAADAEDLFQETAGRVWRSHSGRPAVRSPRAWLITIAYRVFVDFVGRRRSPDALCDVADWRSEEPSVCAVRVEESQRLGLAVEQLSDPLRQVVILHYTGGLTLRETAEALGISEGTVKSRLNAALTNLRSVLT